MQKERIKYYALVTFYYSLFRYFLLLCFGTLFVTKASTF